MVVSSGIGVVSVRRANWRSGDLVQRFFHRRIAVAEPVLQQVNPQHRVQRTRASTAAGLGVVQFDDVGRRLPGHHLFHLGQELLLARLLALASVLGVSGPASVLGGGGANLPM